MKVPKVLGLIPARGGSKGLHRKNTKMLCGQPLIAWTIEAALSSDCITDVVVSTDNDEIATISKDHGALVPFIRPAYLANDNALRNEVVAHALYELKGYDFVILLQPTSPMRKSKHIDEAFSLMVKGKSESCASVVEQHPSPYWMYSLGENNKMVPMLGFTENRPRQKLNKYYCLNGAVFISSVTNFFQAQLVDPFVNDSTCAYVMEPKDSIDIDTAIDFKLAEVLLKNSDF
jgi:CMP-N,N'-diacetyllegionaminic acid synthase